MSNPNFQLPLELQLLIARSAFDSNVRDNLLFNPEEIIKRHGINLDELPTLEIVDYSIDIDGGFNVDKYIVVLPEFVSSVSRASSIKKVGQVINPKLAASGLNVETEATNTTTTEEAEVETTAVTSAEVGVAEVEATATTTTEAAEAETTVLVAAEAVLVAT
jgi:hypothetical protein